MKSILLASASAIAFAGAASAEVSFSGTATLGFNDFDNTVTSTNTNTNATTFGTTTTTTTTTEDDNRGFYWDASLDVTLSQELDNGLTAAVSFGIDIAEDNLGQTLDAGDMVLSLTSDNAGLYFGDTDQSAELHWSGVSGMEADDFAEDNMARAAGILRGEYTFGGITASLSYNVIDGQYGGGIDGMQFAAVGSFGSVDFGLAYQDGTGIADAPNTDDIIGISVGTTLGGADLDLAYADNSNGEQSIGLGVSYPVGPVTLGATFATNSVSGDAWEITAGYADGPISVDAAFDSDNDWSLEGSYDVGNGLVVYAGLVDAGNDYYLGGSYDLGGGASFMVSYAADGDNDEGTSDDDIGAQDYQVGTTVAVSFEF